MSTKSLKYDCLNRFDVFLADNHSGADILYK
jgi:hypothetical protein